MKGGQGVLRARLAIAFAGLFTAVLVYNAFFSYSYSFDTNYRNVSVDTRVNITNAAPDIPMIRFAASPLTLTAGGTTLVQCNVSVHDYNGYQDINYTNATLYHSSSSSGAANNNNTHYNVTNCTLASEGGEYRNYTCNFTVYYYALNGTWTCNATTVDNSLYVSNASNTTIISPLLALNVTPLIDYGNMSVGDTSKNQTANVTNIGNVPINYSVKGYGQNPNDGLAFVCQSGNISVGNEKYSTNVNADYAAKTALGSNFQNITVTIPKSVDGTNAKNTTYWQLYVPPNPFGECNGTVVFQAELS